MGATTLKEACGDLEDRCPVQEDVGAATDSTTVEQDAGSAAGIWHIGVLHIWAGIPASASSGPLQLDLGDGVMRAIDGWSRCQTIMCPQEVKILGMVLDRALIAGEARTAVDDDLTVPPVPAARLRRQRGRAEPASLGVPG